MRSNVERSVPKLLQERVFTDNGWGNRPQSIQTGLSLCLKKKTSAPLVAGSSTGLNPSAKREPKRGKVENCLVPSIAAAEITEQTILPSCLVKRFPSHIVNDTRLHVVRSVTPARILV